MADPHPNEEALLRALAQQADIGSGSSGPCPDPDLLAALLADSLLAEERSPIEEHLARCSACVSVVAELAQDPEVLDEPAGLPRVQAPVAPPRIARWGIAAAAAVLLLALGAGALLRPSSPPAPRTLAQWSASLRSSHPETCADLHLLTPGELAESPPPVERGGFRQFLPAGVELTMKPTFRFAPQSGVSTYQIRLLTDDGTEVWTATTQASEMPYPSHEAALSEGGRYLWEVSFDRLGRQTSRHTFRVATREQIEAFRAATAVIYAIAPQAEGRVLAAQLAIRRTHWAEARRLLEDARSAEPDREVVRALQAYVRAVLGEEAPLGSSKEGD